MVKHVVQLAKNECGIACLKMFYELYEVDKSYNKLLDEVKVEDNGISIEEMLKSLNNLSLFKAYEINIDKLKQYLPSIILAEYGNKKHYIVIWKYEGGYFYISDPCNHEISKIKEKKLLKIFTGIIIFNQKREIILPKKIKYRIKFSNYIVPYVLLSILEVILLTFSMLYLFSIRDFTIIKIYTFLVILFLNCIISLLKNLSFNIIQKNLDQKVIHSKINDDFNNGKINNINHLKDKINKGYQLKLEYIKLLSNIIPKILIIFGTYIYLYFINIMIFLLIIIICIIIFLINIYFSIKKNKCLSIASQEELKINMFEDKILTKSNKDNILVAINNIKEQSSKILIMNQINNLINFAIKQFSLMLILIYMYMVKIEVYSVFVITFYFYSFEGVVDLSEFIIKTKERKILKNSFFNQ